MNKTYSHAPVGYVCPICLAIAGTENEKTMMKQADIFFKDETVMAVINSKFVGNNPGHAIVVPVKHYENIYDIPQVVAHRIFDVAQQTALMMKEVRKCEGVTVLQNNEPASGQHAFHYHMHLFPRFDQDDLHANMNNSRVATPEERLPYADAFRKYLLTHPIK